MSYYLVILYNNMSDNICKYYIYKICSDDLPEFVYVGSTKSFRNRKHLHKSRCLNINDKGHNNKLYTTIRENGNWENWRMVIIEECPNISLIQSKIKEEEWRVKLNGNLNMRKCNTTHQERKEQIKKYNQNNKEKIRCYNKKWREANKVKISQQRKDRYYKKKLLNSLEPVEPVVPVVEQPPPVVEPVQ